MTAEQFLAFNLAWIGAAAAYLCDGAVIGTFIDWRGHPTVHAAAIKLGLEPLNLIVWVKINAGMGGPFTPGMARPAHQLVGRPTSGRPSRGHSPSWAGRANARVRRAAWTR
jgi:hypothetical protein